MFCSLRLRAAIFNGAQPGCDAKIFCQSVAGDEARTSNDFVKGEPRLAKKELSAVDALIDQESLHHLAGSLPENATEMFTAAPGPSRILLDRPR